MKKEELIKIWDGNSYYPMSERYMEDQWEELIYPVIKNCDFTSVVDLACGQGRNIKKLIPISGKIIGIDICQSNLDFCKDRFKDNQNISFKLCSGSAIPVDTASISFLYCFDAMVHFYPYDVFRYLQEARRILKPEGIAFLHHSNYSGWINEDWRYNPHARNYMTQDIFLTASRKNNLEILFSQKIDWGSFVNLDCLTLLQSPKEEIK